jgi:exodeoxyribonuclease VII large subunit
MISAALADRLPRPIKVVGEISGLRDRSHWYFDLKDEAAIVNCVMFASVARKVAFPIQNGLKVVAQGRIDFFPAQGRAQLYVDKLTPIGTGELELRFRQLVAELHGLGWFDPASKRALPAFPRRIAVVTSRSAAALQDVIDTARRRCPMVELALVDVRVQGAQAAPEIARALAWLSANHRALGVDAIILTRGGGSMEDLWAFNERIVAQAIRDCVVPIVAAIGHETDTTIAELVADERCATPTQAAMRLIPDRAALLEQIDATASRLGTSLRRMIRYETQRIRGIARLPWLADPMELVRVRRADLATAARHLRRAVQHATQRRRLTLSEQSVRIARGRPEAAYALRRARLDAIERRLRTSIRAATDRAPLDRLQRALSDAIAQAIADRRDQLSVLHRELRLGSHESILRRGYSITTGPDGSVVRHPSEVAPGQAILTRLADGTIRSIVADQAPATGDAHPAAPPATPGRPGTDGSGPLDSAHAGAPGSRATPSADPAPPRPRPLGRRARRQEPPGQFGLFQS